MMEAPQAARLSQCTAIPAQVPRGTSQPQAGAPQLPSPPTHPPR
jgi:hypothetical protein